jgi:outer membrane biosynthesis protein TonB
MRLRIAAAALALFAGAAALRADWAVQVAAYADDRHLAEAAQRLESEGYPIVTERFTPPNGAPLTRLMVGPYKDRRDAELVRDRLETAGFPGYVRSYKPVSPPSAPTPAPAAPKPTPAPAPAPPPVAAPSTPAPKAPPQPAEESAESAEEEPPPLVKVPGAEEPETPAPSETGEEPAPLLKIPSESEGGAAGGGATRVFGFFLADGAWTYPEPEHWSHARGTLELGAQGKAGALGWKVSGRAFYDAVYDIEDDFYSERVRDEQQWDADVWETYVDLSAGDFDIRLGRQNVIWGEVVGLFFADVVTAKDLRDFVARDFDLIRIPQWAARLEYTKGDFHAELLGIPWMTYDEIGAPGGDFYPIPVGVPPEFTIIILDEDKPARTLENGAWGARLAYAGSGWDVAGFYYDSMDASPAFFRQILATPGGALAVQFTPRHDRIQQFGLTLAKDLSSVVLRAEAVYTLDRLYSTLILDDSDGVVPLDSLDGIVSLDWLPGQSRVTLQLFEKYFPDYVSGILYEEFETGGSISASTKLAGGTLEPEILYVRSFDEQGWMLRGRLSVWPSPAWRIGAGVDAFGGSPLGFFGRYGAKDRVYLESRFTF